MDVTWWLAVSVLMTLVPLELWFWSWQKSVNYPPKPVEMKIFQGVFELLFVALAISVVW